MRRNNREGRLDDGYWFYGNDDYLALSFWSGNDWRNRTPNLIFVVLPNSDTYLEFSVSDSRLKREFVEKFIVEPLKMRKDGQKFRKDYEWGDALKSLEAFIHTDKLAIDNLIRAHASFFDEVKDEQIGFIGIDIFLRALDKTLAYRERQREAAFPAENKSIKSLVIENYGPVQYAAIANIPENTQWIFLTGENGTGKTSILKSIATLLSGTPPDDSMLQIGKQPQLNAVLYSNKGNPIEVSASPETKKPARGLMVSGFCAYGASRLTTNSEGDEEVNLKNLRNRSQPLYGLSHNDGILLDLLYKYRRWSNTVDSQLLNERLEAIREVLYELVPNLHSIEFDLSSDPPLTWYREHDDNESPFEKVPYFKLASGIKSMVGMFGDMMCRLFDQQDYKSDAAELTGVVIIDEIDIHLHPKLQKRMIEQLSITFPKIQFIATTHSPIPLLGAPLNSCFFKIERNSETGVEIVNVSDINVSELLPNTILTSDIFGMSQIFNTRGKPSNRVRAESYYKEIHITDERRRELKEIAEKLKGTNETGG